MTVTGFWFAIEDATLENGCLWAAPGGHLGPLRQVFKRNATNERHGVRTTRRHAAARPPPGDLVPLEVPAGTMVVLTDGSPTGAPSTVADEPPRVFAALHLGAADYPSGTGCSAPGHAVAPPR